MEFFKKNKNVFRGLMVGAIFLFGKNGSSISAQTIKIEKEIINVETLKPTEILLVKNEFNEDECRDCCLGTGIIIVTITYKNEPIDRLPTRNVNELAAVFTAGVSFLQ